ncbi:hypothetical protein [Bradyrhizobium sp. RDI18]|uniref:hypothetical protein n=1 Tax=Bradyrhizobium sp. RDI18 TaxID=3367400 RepID=UPI0037207991
MILADGSAEATGGDGADTFVFNFDALKGEHNTATITDFAKVDKLQLLNDVYVKVSSDHHGGTLLQVGDDDTIDLLDVKPNGLHHRDWT